MALGSGSPSTEYLGKSAIIDSESKTDSGELSIRMAKFLHKVTIMMIKKKVFGRSFPKMETFYQVESIVRA